MSRASENKKKTLRLYNSYKRQCLSMAQNVFKFENLPEYMDLSYLNRKLLFNGAVAFFEDEVLGLLALPFSVLGKLDVYYRPQNIIVYGSNGYTKRISGQKNFVIMYDNLTKNSIVPDIIEYVDRLTTYTRVQDINVLQQKTPRAWLTNGDNKETLKAIINDIDSDTDAILTYDNMAITNLQGVIQPAPYLIDKLQIQKREIWSEFLRLIGIANLDIQKKERLIKDEIQESLGGTLASRFNRYESRKRAVQEINKKFGTNIEVSYIDDLEKKEEVENNEELFNRE